MEKSPFEYKLIRNSSAIGLPVRPTSRRLVGFLWLQSIRRFVCNNNRNLSSQVKVHGDAAENPHQGLPLRPENLALGALLVGWGGVSVQFQTLSLLADSEMKSAPHLTGRLLSAILGAFWAYLLSVLLL